MFVANQARPEISNNSNSTGKSYLYDVAPDGVWKGMRLSGWKFNETFTNINDFEVQERKIIKRARHTINNYYKNNKFISNLYKNKAIILNERIGYEKVHLKKVISIVDDSLIKDVDDYNELTKVYLKNIYYIKKK